MPGAQGEETELSALVDVATGASTGDTEAKIPRTRIAIFSNLMTLTPGRPAKSLGSLIAIDLDSVATRHARTPKYLLVYRVPQAARSVEWMVTGWPSGIRPIPCLETESA